MTPTEQDKELRDFLEQNGWKFYEELNGFRKESKFTIPMFSPDQSKSYDTLSAGNYYELVQLITADRKRVELEARIEEVEVSIIELERSDDPRFYSKDEAIRSQRARYTQLKAQQEEK